MVMRREDKGNAAADSSLANEIMVAVGVYKIEVRRVDSQVAEEAE
jgi:hypothetical protein